MPRKLEEISATVLRERWRSADAERPFVILECSPLNGSVAKVGEAARNSGHEAPPRSFTVKCEADGDDPRPHMAYRFWGHWEPYRDKSGEVTQTLAAKTFVADSPHTRAGIITYLDKAPGIGRVLAGQLWEKFKGDAIRILHEHPDVAAGTISRLSLAAAQEASAWLEENKELREIMVDLIDLIDGRGFPKDLPKLLVKTYGNRAAERVKRDPHSALRRFRGCGFKRTDQLYLDLGLNPGRLKRQSLCAAYHLDRNGDGSTWQYRQVIDAGLSSAIAGADVRADAAIELGTRSGLLSIRRTDGVTGPLDWDGNCVWASPAPHANAEARLAAAIVARLQDTSAVWPDECRSVEGLSDHQREIVQHLLCSPLAVLGGGPGVGKTYTVSRILAVLGRIFGFDKIATTAYTGKAAVRLSEVMNGYNLPLVARTIHSLLRVEAAEGDGWRFAFNEANPLPCKVLVVDEASMLDVEIASHLFAAIARGTLVLVVGDVGQLLPVGHGAPLRDMIAAGVPYGELTEIRRNEGGIVQACADIRDGRPFTCDGNLAAVETRDADAQCAAMLDTVDALAREMGVDPVWGVQVICPLNSKGAVARKKLNKILRDHLNPNPNVAGSPFRMGEKIVCTKNGHLPLVEVACRRNGRVELVENDDNLEVNAKGCVRVANGELGRVVKIEPKLLHVQMTAPRRLVLVPRGKASDVDQRYDEEGEAEDKESTGTGCDWELAYCISGHKSQGSEWDGVVVMVDEAAKRLCSSEWWKTAISRGKKRGAIVGRLAIAQQQARRSTIGLRKTFLKELIQQGMAAL
jgi:exodeoxyribonuclease V alpha subunit